MANVATIRKLKSDAPPKVKAVEGNQKAVDALAFNSGMWKVTGVPGLYVRARATSKSYMLQRRIEGELVKTMLGQLTLKAAKEKAMALWGTVRSSEPAKVITLGAAIEDYILAKIAVGKMSPKTAEIARYNAQRYLGNWTGRTLQEIGRARLEVRQLQEFITRKYGAATSNQVIRLLSAVYRWCRKVDVNLPESPMVVAEIHRIKPRDSAYSAEELRRWWNHTVEVDGKTVHKGVSTLSVLKRTWWLVALLSGARRGSIEALRWEDVNLDAKVLRFSTAKRGMVYSVPMSDVLARLLEAYKSNPDIPPSEWCFPSPSRAGAHIAAVKNGREGVSGPHALRHTFRTTLAELQTAPDAARLLMGHSLSGDVSLGYITSSLVIESLRPVVNAVAQHYAKIIPGIVK
jgi:integrase